MSDPQTEPTAVHHFFVDEAGDPTLFDRRGRVLVGTPGCSARFVMGNLRVTDPDGLADDLEGLRRALLADPYFRGVPSFDPARRKTIEKFHAKDDLPEVRREVFRLLASRDLRFDAIVKDKAALVVEVRRRNAADPSYRYQENELYDDLVAALFARPRDAGGGGAGESVEARVCFSRRGKRDRTRALAEALARAEVEFERVHGLARTPPAVTAAAPAESGGLQAVDYFLWAVQRFYELGEDRYLRLVRPQVGEIHDLDADGGAGRTYKRDEPLTS